MNDYFENKLTYNEISFCHTNKTKIDEREIHTYNEILFYMGDEISFITELFKRNIKKNTLIFIPKEKYHYFDNGGKNSLARLKIGFYDNIKMDCNISIIENPDEAVFFAVRKIISTLSEESTESRKIEAFGAFYILIAEIMKAKNQEQPPFDNKSYVVSECVEYINENLKNSVSIKKLSEKLNISESALTHTFKKEMGISVHKYIQQKRLVFARKLIEEGKKPTKIYFDLGYSEYSAFYKAYFKMFGHPPSNKYK